MLNIRSLHQVRVFTNAQYSFTSLVMHSINWRNFTPRSPIDSKSVASRTVASRTLACSLTLQQGCQEVVRRLHQQSEQNSHWLPRKEGHGNLISSWTSPPQPKTNYKSVGRKIVLCWESNPDQSIMRAKRCHCAKQPLVYPTRQISGHVQEGEITQRLIVKEKRCLFEEYDKVKRRMFEE